MTMHGADLWKEKENWKNIENKKMFFCARIVKFNNFFALSVKFNPNNEFSRAKWLFCHVKIFWGLLLVQFKKICWSCFFAKSLKLWFWPFFWHIWPKSAKMRIFIKNRVVLFFYPYCPPTSCQVLEKSVERFPRSIRYIHPNIRTYKGDPIEPVAFAGSCLLYTSPSPRD